MTFYITTPIYYVNDVPHIGHAYTTVVADVLYRYRKLFGEESYFLTGTDEHGQKVDQAAQKRGKSPQEHCDEMCLRFQEIWKELNISNDIFMRTTFPYHIEVVQKCIQQLFDCADIYSHEYEGWYSISEEIFYTEKDLVNGKSPMGKEVTKLTEKNYFFRMSKYQERLIQYIEDNPHFIQPEGKKSEVLGFLKQPLQDLCISRPKARLSWGIEIPFDKDFVTYVWFDALLNYASAIGLKQSPEKQAMFDKFWPNVVHLLGKDILITHTVYWTTMLMALDLPLPKIIFAHGWWLNDDGGKMSKSEGKVVSPLEMKDLVGVDPFRYFLIRETVLGNDALFSPEIVVSRINSELSNNFGNLHSRASNLIDKHFEGKLPGMSDCIPETALLAQHATATAGIVKDKILNMHPQGAIIAVIELLTSTNKYIDAIAPWKLVKEGTPDAMSKTAECLTATLEVLRIAAILLSPVMPTKCDDLLKRIGLPELDNINRSFESASKWGVLKKGTFIVKGDGLFGRITL